jgi:hypothetical protein
MTRHKMIHLLFLGIDDREVGVCRYRLREDYYRIQ